MAPQVDWFENVVETLILITFLLRIIVRPQTTWLTQWAPVQHSSGTQFLVQFRWFFSYIWKGFSHIFPFFSRTFARFSCTFSSIFSLSYICKGFSYILFQFSLIHLQQKDCNTVVRLVSNKDRNEQQKWTKNAREPELIVEATVQATVDCGKISEDALSPGFSWPPDQRGQALYIISIELKPLFKIIAPSSEEGRALSPLGKPTVVVTLSKPIMVAGPSKQTIKFRQIFALSSSVEDCQIASCSPRRNAMRAA